MDESRVARPYDLHLARPAAQSDHPYKLNALQQLSPEPGAAFYPLRFAS